MKIITSLFIALFIASCSSTPKQESYSIASAQLGLMKSDIAPFPVYLMNKFESRTELEKKYSKKIFTIHTGHILNPSNKKEKNEQILKALSERGINLVNLTLEDLAVANEQNLNLENYPQVFLNSSIVDLGTDDLAQGKNIHPYYVQDGVAFVGLSDRKYEKNLHTESYLISDYVLAILRAKKLSQKQEHSPAIKSFIIIHDIGKEIDEVMTRLPPNFINSLAK